MSARHIYIVDDDEAVRDSLQLLLEAWGYHVTGFASARSLLDTVEKLPFGCLIVDLQMPEMNGLELQNALAQRGVKLPVVVVTAHGDVGTAVRAMRAGAIDFVEKPFSDDAIHAAITLALAEQPTTSAEDRARAAIRTRLQVLSPREREVLQGLVAGHANKVIAYNLSLSPRTVEIHRARVMDKMHARSLSELVRLALAAGVTPDTAL